jgi:hypothetical protein
MAMFWMALVKLGSCRSTRSIADRAPDYNIEVAALWWWTQVARAVDDELKIFEMDGWCLEWTWHQTKTGVASGDYGFT